MSEMITQDPAQKRASLSDTKRALLERRLRGEAGMAPAREPIGRLAGPGPEHPASFAQERMWFLTRFDPDKPLYNVPVAVLVPVGVDVPLLERALTEVVRRHEALRTSFRMGDDGQLMQVVHEPFPMTVEVKEMRHRVGERFADGVNDLVAEEGSYPFDLEKPPLMRVTLLRVSEGDYAMVTTTHHIVTDGWAYPVMNREIMECYGAWKEGREPDLPPVTLRYADYTVWQRQMLQGENLERQVRYWRDLLQGAPVLDLPTDRPRPPVASQRGRFHRLRFDAALVDRLRGLCQREAATLNMVLMAGFYALLARYAGQDDLVVGTLLGNRPRKELEDIVGVFVNTAALRVRLDGDPTFRDAIKRVKRAVLDADVHQDLPFEKLVEELGVPRDLSRHQVFQVLYFHHVYAHSHHDMDADGPEVLEMRPVHPDHDADLIDTGVAKFDLLVATMETGGGLAGVFEYATDLFDAATIERMVGHYRLLLDAASRDPGAPLSSHSLTTEAERRRLEAWGTGAPPHAASAPLHAPFEAQAARTPNAVALAFEGGTMTYGELDRRANQVAHRLRRHGVGAEVRVGVCMERGPEMVAALLGILKAGGAYVPLDPDYPRDRLAWMLDDAGVAVLLAQPHLRGTLPPHGAATVEIDPAFAAVAGEPETPVAGEADPAALAYVIYTSGSTGRPKGAGNAHAGVANRLAWMQAEYGLAPADAVLQKTPFSFDVSVWEFFWPLSVGARLVLARPGGQRDAAYLARLIEREGITTAHFVPSMLAAFLEAAPADRCASLRRVVCSGEALPAELVARFYDRMGGVGNAAVRLHNLYGPTEAAVDVTYWPCAPGEAASVVPIGRPVAGTRVHVLDGRGAPVPAGVPGELYIGGVQVGRGYLGRPALTAEKFVPDPLGASPGARLYRTGDRVRWSADGVLLFMGRLDDQVKLRGYRIELGEVESELLRHPGVSAAAAMVREDAPGDPRLVAYVVGRDGSTPAGAELHAFLRERLPEYMVPGVFVALDALPLTGSGKTDRKALPAPDLAAETAAAEEIVAPRNVVEEMLAEIWAEVLNRAPIGVTQNFFALGGHSLLATQVLVRIGDTFEVELPIRTFFTDPTVVGLAAAIEAAGSPVLAQMMDELEGLSAEEIEALLAEDAEA
jgi:amino acid adenylation domain-containing protein